MKNIIEGLRSLPRDGRDLKYERKFGALLVLPEEDFVVGTPQQIKNQLNSDFCTAFAGCYISEFQEGVELSPEWQFAKIKQLEGDPYEWGADLRSTCKSFVRFGSLKAKDAPFNLVNKDRNFLANSNNWDSNLDEQAKEHKKQSYFRLTDAGYVDLFDSIRGALYQNRGYKRAVLTGVMWRNMWTYAQSGIVDKDYNEGGFGHSFCWVGQKKINNKIYLRALLSNGDDIGDTGYFYFPREVVNQECTFGNYMFVDEDPNQAKKEYWTWQQKVIDFWKKYLQALNL